MEKKIFTVGPVYVRDEVRAEMSNQMFSHRSENYTDLQSEVVPKLKRLMQTENDVFLFTNTATGVWEACIRNCVSEGGRVLSCVNGAFSKRWSQVVEANGRTVDVLEKEMGEPILPEELDAALSESDAEAVTIVHNETSAGVLNPLEELLSVTKKYDVLSFVDTVSSIGGTEVDVDKWGIDVCLFSVQKCLAVPPGLAVGSVSARALELSSEMKNKGYYFDFMVLKKYMDKNQTPSTPAIPQIFALNKQLDIIFEEGLENVWARHKEVSDYVKSESIGLGMKLFPDPDYASPTLSCLETPGRNAKDVVSALKERGYVIGSGYGNLKEKTIRIGNMGNIYMEDVEDLMGVMKEVY